MGTVAAHTDYHRHIHGCTNLHTPMYYVLCAVVIVVKCAILPDCLLRAVGCDTLTPHPQFCLLIARGLTARVQRQRGKIMIASCYHGMILGGYILTAIKGEQEQDIAFYNISHFLTSISLEYTLQ